MPVRKIFGALFLLTVLSMGKGFCQGKQSLYLFHTDNVPTPHSLQETSRRAWKTSIDAGLLFGFANPVGYSANYVNGISAKTGYTFGVIEEIPIQQRSYLKVGVEIVEEGVSFNSYFFAPGYSFLYINNLETFSHDIVMNEIHIPILFKTRIGAIDRKNRSVFMTFGGKFRYMSYTNTSVTNDETGYLVYEGQKDASFLYHMFSPFGSPIVELGLGYQRDTQKKRKRGWYMTLEYNYGISPIIYTGNRDGSNYVVFRLNTLLFKIGKLF